MENDIERPLALEPPPKGVFGTDESREYLNDIYDQQFEFYCSLVISKWDRKDAFRAAMCALAGALSAKINYMAEEAENNG